MTAAALLSALVTPVVVSAASGDDAPQADAAGKKKGDPVQIQVRNRSRGETGLVTVSTGYSMRLSNKQVGDGGGAIYGCRSAPNTESCVNADNLNTGLAFFFRSQKGAAAGRIEAAGGANAKPFTTNATGVATGLNADQVEGQEPGDIAQSARSGGSCPAGTASTGVGSCVESALRPGATFANAAQICGAANRRLPLVSELFAVRAAGVGLGDPELSESVYQNGPNFEVTAVT
ncbi:MAG: hypothetical protein H0T15_01395, partial [Thermoleophilaceae bacterium]|nr:hypothetical protein [Thermoleophilaceae bacterium]